MRKARRMALGRQYVRFVPKKHNMIDLSVIQDITSKIAGRAGWRVAPVAPKLPLRQTLTIRLSAGTARMRRRVGWSRIALFAKVVFSNLP